MRRGRILIFLILIVVVGLGVLYVFLNQGGGGATPAATEVAVIQVYYAAQNIPQGTIITQEMLGKYPFPQGINVAEVMFTEGEEANLVGKRARFTLEPGTVITSSMVGTAPGELSGPAWAVQIPPSMVAVAIPTNRLATAAYGVNDGAHVNVNACMTFVDVDPAYQSQLPNFVSGVQDVYFPPVDKGRPYISIEPLTQEFPSRQGRVELDPTFQKPIYTVPSENQRPRLVCQAILQDVVVMNLGNFQLQAPPSADPNATPSPTQAEPPPDIITLIVSPQDSVSLNYFVYSGAVLTMALRRPDDRSQIDAQSVTLTSLLSQYRIDLPSKLPFAQQPRLDNLVPPFLPNDKVVQPTQ